MASLDTHSLLMSEELVELLCCKSKEKSEIESQPDCSKQFDRMQIESNEPAVPAKVWDDTLLAWPLAREGTFDTSRRGQKIAEQIIFCSDFYE